MVAYNGSAWIDVPKQLIEWLTAITRLRVQLIFPTDTNLIQYGNTEDPTIYAINGTTIAFDLNDTAQ